MVKENAEKRKQNSLILPLILLAVLLSAALFMLLLRGCEADAGTNPVKGVQLQENTVAWDGELPNLTGGEAKGIQLPGYGEITVMQGDTTLKITLVNPEGNPCYFRYRLELPDSGTVLYESDLIEPGRAVKEISLEHLPDVGDYNLDINIDTYSLEDGVTAMNGGVCSTVLHVI